MIGRGLTVVNIIIPAIIAGGTPLEDLVDEVTVGEVGVGEGTIDLVLAIVVLLDGEVWLDGGQSK